MELLRRTFIARGALDEAGNGGLVAVSRLTPGTNILAYCVGLGWSLHRWPGALTSLVASSLPASIIVCALAAALVRVHESPIVAVILAAAVLVATLLVLSSAAALLRPYANRGSAMRASIVALFCCALLAADVTPVRILLLSAALGACVGGAKRSPIVE